MSAPGKRSRVDYIAILAVCFLTLVLSWLVGPDRYVQRLITKN